MPFKRWNPVIFYIVSIVSIVCISPKKECNAQSVIIGDSLFRSGFPFLPGTPSPLSQSLESFCGHPIENHALVGASLESGYIKSIRQQFDSLWTSPSSSFTTIIMDGGGNDVMSHKNACLQYNTECQNVVQNSVRIAETILDDASVRGVRTVVYLGFYYLKGLEKTIRVGNKDIGDLCDSYRNTSFSCFFVNPAYNETTGQGLRTPQMIGSDGIHPNEEGYKLLANMIWNVTIQYNITV